MVMESRSRCCITSTALSQQAHYSLGSGGRIVKREFFEAGRLARAEFDDDGDGVFERKVRYDRLGEPEL